VLTAIEAKIRSGPMYKWRTESGLTGKEAAALAGVSQQSWCALELLRFHRVGYGIAQKVSECIGCLPEDLIPKELSGKDVGIKGVAYKHLAAERMYALATQRRLELPAPDEEIELTDKRELIKKALTFLPYREREIVKLRYGLGEGGQTYTLEEVGRIMKITRARVRQIEVKAIMRMQQPIVVNTLKGMGFKFEDSGT